MDAIKKETLPSTEKFYTYADYCKFKDDKRREIINGVIYLMTAPLEEHQIISGNLHTEFNLYFRGKKCQVFHAPYDVRLPQKGETKAAASTVVQPDLVVICDKNKRGRRGCFGAPDLVIEILSPATSRIDKVKKFNLYQEHGVKEYWIVDPYSQAIDRFFLAHDKYLAAEHFFRDDTITPVIFPDFTIKLEDVFPAFDNYDKE